MESIPYEYSSGNVFADMGFTPAEASNLTSKSQLIMAVCDIIRECDLTQQEAGILCANDEPTLSNALRGRMEGLTIQKLVAWLNALGRNVENYVRTRDGRIQRSEIVVAP